MRKDFVNFIKRIRKAAENGELETSIKLSDFDLAVQYAIGIIGIKKGYPCEVSLEEIEKEIGGFAPELLDGGEKG